VLPKVGQFALILSETLDLTKEVVDALLKACGVEATEGCIHLSADRFH